MLAYNSDHKYITKVFAHCYMDNMHMHMEYDWQWWWHRTKCEHYLSPGSKHHRTHRTKYKHYLSLSQNTTEHTDTEQSVSIIWSWVKTALMWAAIWGAWVTGLDSYKEQDSKESAIIWRLNCWCCIKITQLTTKHISDNEDLRKVKVVAHGRWKWPFIDVDADHWQWW